MAKVITVSSIKGGVGKTITTSNLAVVLAELNNKVLLVDNDPQGNLSTQFEMYSTGKPTLFDLLTNESIHASEVVKETNITNIDIITSNLSLATVSKIVQEDKYQHNLLETKLKKIEDYYDYILIDCGPNLDLLTINALVYSDYVLSPIKVDKNALEGINYLLDLISEIQEAYNPKLKHIGCLVTMYRDVKIDNLIVNGYSEDLNLFSTYIRDTVHAKESTFDQPLVIYKKNATASQDYREFTKEFIQRTGADQK